MGSVVIGIDPDSEKYGFAGYLDGTLKHLEEIQLPQLVAKLLKLKADHKVLVSIEDVMANKFIYGRNEKQSKAAQSKVGMSVGRCQQSQVELMRWLDYHGIAYKLHKPQKGNWADNKALFEKITGWKGRSNADTRSASYFGWLALGAVKNG